QRWMDLHSRFSSGGVELLDHPRLGAGVVVLLVPSGREVQRVVGVRFLAGGAVNHNMEASFPVGVGEPRGEQSRRAGMLLAGARPEDALFAVDAVVADP